MHYSKIVSPLYFFFVGGGLWTWSAGHPNFLFLLKFKLLLNAKFDYSTLPSILSKFSIVAPQV